MATSLSEMFDRAGDLLHKREIPGYLFSIRAPAQTFAALCRAELLAFSRAAATRAAYEALATPLASPRVFLAAAQSWRFLSGGTDSPFLRARNRVEKDTITAMEHVQRDIYDLAHDRFVFAVARLCRAGVTARSAPTERERKQAVLSSVDGLLFPQALRREIEPLDAVAARGLALSALRAAPSSARFLALMRSSWLSRVENLEPHIEEIARRHLQAVVYFAARIIGREIIVTRVAGNGA